MQGGRPRAERNSCPEVIAERLTKRVGVTLSDEERQRAGTALQWAVGAGAGVLYGVLRPRYASVRADRGLAYGAAFSLVVDEGLVPLLGFAPGPAAFPWPTHARGFLGHLAFGAVAEAALARLDRGAVGSRSRLPRVSFEPLCYSSHSGAFPNKRCTAGRVEECGRAFPNLRYRPSVCGSKRHDAGRHAGCCTAESDAP